MRNGGNIGAPEEGTSICTGVFLGWAGIKPDTSGELQVWDAKLKAQEDNDRKGGREADWLGSANSCSKLTPGE